MKKFICRLLGHRAVECRDGRYRCARCGVDLVSLHDLTN